MAYDEHEVNNTFKFGVVYQKFGQVSGPDGSLLNRVKKFQDELNINSRKRKKLKFPTSQLLTKIFLNPFKRRRLRDVS